MTSSSVVSASLSSGAVLSATAVAHPNVALIKYWGKRDSALNLPAVGSISITLGGLRTRTTVSFDPALDADALVLNGTPIAPSQEELHKVRLVLDLVRVRAALPHKARVVSDNDFPTGAGLASSASGFAALVLAATHAAGIQPSADELSVLARRGSGSAARSLYGGFVEMMAGTRADGLDAVAHALLPPQAWPLHVFVAVTTSQRKSTSSTAGMQSTRATSPFSAAWVDGAPADLAAMREAIAARDFQRVGELAEHSCLKMHGLMLSGRPGLVYWRGPTVELIHAVRDLRAQGTAAYFTIDAGPQVKVMCLPADAERVRTVLASVNGVERIIPSGLGAGARIVTEAP